MFDKPKQIPASIYTFQTNKIKDVKNHYFTHFYNVQHSLGHWRTRRQEQRKMGRKCYLLIQLSHRQLKRFALSYENYGFKIATTMILQYWKLTVSTNKGKLHFHLLELFVTNPMDFWILLQTKLTILIKHWNMFKRDTKMENQHPTAQDNNALCKAYSTF